MENGKEFNFIDRIKNIKNHRSVETSIIYALAELGELSEEVLINNSLNVKEQGKDGILGESVDVIVCMLDIIQLHNPDITDNEILELIDKKINKWENKNYIKSE